MLHFNNLVFHPQPHSGRFANFLLNVRRKKVATVGIEPRPLAQQSETQLTEHLLRV